MQFTSNYRFHPEMGITVALHWRKSSQWFALNRKHAAVVVADTAFYPIFQQHCMSGWDNDTEADR